MQTDKPATVNSSPDGLKLTLFIERHLISPQELLFDTVSQ